jgi:hypothetical protein
MMPIPSTAQRKSWAPVTGSSATRRMGSRLRTGWATPRGTRSTRLSQKSTWTSLTQVLALSFKRHCTGTAAHSILGWRSYWKHPKRGSWKNIRLKIEFIGIPIKCNIMLRLSWQKLYRKVISKSFQIL